MELVNYSDDEEEEIEENNKKEDAAEAPAVLKSRWTTTVDSDDEEEQVTEPKSVDEAPKSVSVLELLSTSQKPSFLTKQSEQQFQVKAVINKDYSLKPKVPIIEQPTPQELAKSNVMSRAEFEEIAKSKAVSEMMKQAEEDLPLNAKISSVKRTDKETAKERVKRQRLSGQSGIGEDFKVWKTDEEMRQRQQYD